MATFNEFRNSFPESSNEKGERFEIFLSEWMFKHHPALSRQFKKVWRFSEWPGAWSQKDLGTDLIAEDQHGKICAIQAKFYKEKNSIPKGHIDSFLSDSNRKAVDYRLLIATTDNLGPNARKTIEGQEKEVQTFLLHHFLEPFEWPESIDSLEDYQPRQPHKPRPHQQAAIDDVCAKIEGRGQLLMACGTGKTLTGQRITEALGSKTTLVLLPSLLLLSKTVTDWVSEKEEDFIYLPVCSDKSATKKTDEISLNNSELCFRSTTDPTEIARFLKRPETKVVFSTYQSSPQIAEAFKAESLKPFDLIIADEAHRCAGKVSSDYSMVLSEDLIPSEKRLFMTATPRTYSSRLKQSATEADVQVASMDDEQVFGPVLHHLTFRQAIENDKPLLTDYRVVVVGVNDALVREQVEERAFVKTESGLEYDARSLATQLGLSKAIRDYDLKRVISFHSFVKSASDFSSSFIRLQDDLKTESKLSGKIEYKHVSGAMPTSQRNRELRALGELRDVDRYIVGNARCLSEGVDVPALDGVAFVDPKRSEIDIIQAVGRAIRLAKGKSLGTIVIPVFISEFEDPDAAMQSSAFDQIWKVLRALRCHDDALGEELDALRRGLGKGREVSLTGTKLVLDLPTTIGARFLEAFEIRLIEATTESWEYWMGMLEEYKERHGNLLISKASPNVDVTFGNWVTTQRNQQKSGLLSKSRYNQLNNLGFVWDVRIEKWLRRYNALIEFKAINGHCKVAKDKSFKGFLLGEWVSAQRDKKKAGTLAQYRIELLDEIGFLWDPFGDIWTKGLELLQRFKNQYGHVNISADYCSENFELGEWVFRQRAKRKRLPLDRIKALDELGFIWNKRDADWEIRFQLLRDFKQANGHCAINSDYKPGGIPLSDWARTQRHLYKKAKLRSDRIAKLESIGFIWDKRVADWDTKYYCLAAYREKHGDCLVKAIDTEGEILLGQWVAFLRHTKQDLSPERIARLDEIGFVWRVKN